MAISAVSTSRLAAYRALTRPVPTSPDQVEGAAAPAAADETLHRQTAPGLPAEPVPYVNARGELTGTTVNTTA